MNKLLAVLLAAIILAACGCARVVGPYYLEQEQYEEGIRVLGERFAENPQDASSAYYLGRYHLALNQPEQALGYLEKAAALNPGNADYAFWIGVARWALLDFEGERAAYERAISLDPNHISAHLYLGHGYMDETRWSEALTQYDRVIELDEFNPEALYNRARALGELGRTGEELVAWKKFLEYYPDGSMAMEVTERLNLQGDFTYRNHIIGSRNVTLRSMAFRPGTAIPDSENKASLQVLAAMMQVNDKLTVHVVVYVKGNAALARDRARALREVVLSGKPGFGPERLPLSWFATPETIEVGEASFTLDESVNFITEVQ